MDCVPALPKRHLRQPYHQTVYRPPESSRPTDGQADELMQLLRRRALADVGDDHPQKVTVVGTRAAGDEFTVIYRQAASPQLLGRRGSVADFAALFEPRQTMSQLAGILLQAMSEPSGPGRPGASDWARNLVPDPSLVGWVGV